MTLIRFLKLDSFLMWILLAVILASFAPVTGNVATFFNVLTQLFIVLLFFMHGAKLSRTAIIQGILHWKLHLFVIFTTFIFFPLMAFFLMMIPNAIMPKEILMGFIYLCAMPATVQSAIAFTSTAHGNVSAAICSASLSSILGVFISPFIILAMMDIDQSMPFNIKKSIVDILLMLFLPFVVGHLSRPLVGKWIEKNKKVVKFTDQSAIILIVYVAFSEAVVEHIWQQVSINELILITILSTILLFLALAFTTFLSKLLKFSEPDQITIIFCGSKKSLANGVPMANILFPSNLVGIIILPLMIFHQIQLIVCAFIAGHYAKKNKD